jgi:hypothetical protein
MFSIGELRSRLAVYRPSDWETPTPDGVDILQLAIAFRTRGSANALAAPASQAGRGTAAQLLTEQFGIPVPPSGRDWLIANISPRGIALLALEPDSKKTSVALYHTVLLQVPGDALRRIRDGYASSASYEAWVWPVEDTFSPLTGHFTVSAVILLAN